MNFIACLFPAAATAILFALGFGLGHAILGRWRRAFKASIEYHCFALGIGMGILSHGVLILGLLGGWKMGGFLALGLAAAIAGAVGLWRGRAATHEVRDADADGPGSLHESPDPDAKESTRAFPAPLQLLGLIALAVLLISVGLRATLPSAEYDVLEYHLGAVRHWLREGGIHVFPSLFYASLPFEVEMWYAAGCFVEGNPLLPFTPKLINFGLLLLNMATLYALASRLCRSHGLRVLACLIFGVHPLASIVALDALNDLGVTWFATLGVLAWVRWLEGRERVFFVLWSVMLGMSVCCKYTAVGLVVFPAVVCLLPAALLADGGSEPSHAPSISGLLRRFGGYGLVMAVIIGVVFLPWAIKNLLHHGNPVYPLLAGIFPTPTWLPEQTQYYLEAHGRTSPLHAAYWRALLRNVLLLSPWLAAAVAGGCLVKRDRGHAVAITGAIVAGLAVHSFFPGNPARFMTPFLPLAAVLVVRLVDEIHRTQRPWRAAIMAPFIFWVALGVIAATEPEVVTFHTEEEIDGRRVRKKVKVFERIGMPLFTDSPAIRHLAAYLRSDRMRLQVLGDSLGSKVVESQWFINEKTPPQARVFLLYEARIGCFERDIEVGSVFDRSPLLDRAAEASSAAELLDRLRAEGFDCIYVNEYELYRIISHYGPRDLYKERLTQHGELKIPRDLPTVLQWVDLYPPYYQDERFARCREVLEQFIEGRRRRASFMDLPGFPYGLWVAPLHDD